MHGDQEGERQGDGDDFVRQQDDEDKEAHVDEDGDGEKDRPTIHSIHNIINIVLSNTYTYHTI